MHELGIAQSLAETAWESAQEAGLSRVSLVRAAIGALSGVDPDSLISAWEIVRDRLGLETSTLQCEVVPVTIYCHQCGETIQPTECWRLVCPICQTPGGDLRTGRELLLIQLEGES
jgi:hydrogenase nickel incorporation protein HypA/HybF